MHWYQWAGFLVFFFFHCVSLALSLMMSVSAQLRDSSPVLVDTSGVRAVTMLVCEGGSLALLEGTIGPWTLTYLLFFALTRALVSINTGRRAPHWLYIYVAVHSFAWLLVATGLGNHALRG